MSRQVRPFLGNYVVGELPRGCRLCSKGAKLVLLATGECNAGCFYCPLSTEKKGRDVVFANELKVGPDDIEAVLKEAKTIDALGTGITGGDPLERPERTLGYIGALKERFTEDHHIHLYTSIPVDEPLVSKLASAGLDEIRFHPPPTLWGRLMDSPYRRSVQLCKDSGMDAGLEIPALPKHEQKVLSLIDVLEALDADFLNLNELEYSETNWSALKGMGMTWRSETSNAMKGSENAAMSILQQASDIDLNISVHYCTSAYKDGVQLRNRLKRRAKNIARPHDAMTDDGTLIRGLIVLDPSIGSDGIAKAIEDLVQAFDVPDELVAADGSELMIAPWVLEEIAPDLEVPAFLIEIYPTADALEVERTPLNKAAMSASFIDTTRNGDR